MRVAYYLQTHFLDTALPRIQALSRLVELHLLLELPKSGWRSSVFDQSIRKLRPGMADAELIFDSTVWDRIRQYLGRAASFRVIVHNNVSISPMSWLTSRVATRAIKQLAPDLLHLDDH